jgi:hypothetical protein
MSSDKKYKKSGVSHVDIAAFESHRTFLEDYYEATDNIKALGLEDDEQIEELADRMANVMESERSRRNAHYWRYCAMFRIASNQRLFTGPENVAEAGLLDLNERVKKMDDDDYAFARSLQGKGISAELGHVDQLGDWNSAKQLDAMARALPRSERLAQEGFVFGDTFDKKDEAMINYGLYVTSHGGGRLNVKGVRKRAAADILTEDGNVYEIVKQSTFLIDGSSISREQQAIIEKTIETQQLKPARKENGKQDEHDARRIKGIQAEAMNEAGRSLIEPFIADAELRERSTAVMAVTSLYFALHRHR